ncbi:MAG: glycosyltransferase [Propionibacteriaceae bacterium]|jgi:UDP-D-galactose:(glucosyl)LPS alpha-1,6-D-galactosyltransferase|nr:glycosyltransferase [Propionibacteriaceae bacterium]
MRVLVVLPHLSGQGGIETVVSIIMDHVALGADHWRLASPSGMAGSSWQPASWPLVVGDGRGRFLAERRWLRSICADDDHDVIITISRRNTLEVLTLRRQLRSRAKVVWWPHFSLRTGSMAQRAMQAILDKVMLPRIDHCLAISSGIASQLVAAGVSASRVTTVFNPVLLDPSAPLIPPSQDSTIRLAYVGRLLLDGQKNLRELIAAVRTIGRPVHLQFVGDGPDRAEIERIFGSAMPPEVTADFTGWVQDPWAQICNADGLVLVSRYEGLGLVLVEAIWRGLPVISSDCDTGPADIVNASNGLLYPPGDGSALRARIVGLKQDRDRFNPQTMRDSVATFAPVPYIVRLREALRELAEAGGGRP